MANKEKIFLLLGIKKPKLINGMLKCKKAGGICDHKCEEKRILHEFNDACPEGMVCCKYNGKKLRA